MTLSKLWIKSWRATGYCELFGRTSVPCMLPARADQSAFVGVGGCVGETCCVGDGLAVGVPLLVCDGDDSHEISSPGNAPTAQRARNSRRLILSGRKLSG